MRQSNRTSCTSRTRLLAFLLGVAVTAWPAVTQAQSQGLDRRVSALEARTSALEQQVATQGQQLTNLQGQLATQGQQIAALTQRVGILEPLSLTVHCGQEGQTVAAALAQAGQRASRVVITVVGVCKENVTILRNNTVLRGTADGDGLEALSPESSVLGIGAKDVSLDGLTIRGGRGGVHVERGSSVRMSNSRVVDSTFHGVMIFSAFLELANTTVEGSAVVGVQAMSGSTLRLVNNSSVIGNNAGALDIADGSFAMLGDGSRLEGNGWGVGVSFGSTLHVFGNAFIENNQGPGITATGGSVVQFGGVAVIKGNTGHGVMLRDTSVISSLFEGGAAEITDNTGWGVFCTAGPPAVAQIVGQIGTVTGNTMGQISCPVTW